MHVISQQDYIPLFASEIVLNVSKKAPFYS